MKKENCEVTSIKTETRDKFKEWLIRWDNLEDLNTAEKLVALDEAIDILREVPDA